MCIKNPKIYSETEEKLAAITGFRVKIVEKSRTTLKSILVRSDPWAEGKCGSRKCLPCETGVKNSKCRKRNVLYESTCKECLHTLGSRVGAGMNAPQSSR